MNVSLLVFVAFLIRTHAVEPMCSKFPYEEALLEKMIRSEFKYEQLQAEVKATLDRVESTLKKYSDLTETKFAKLEEFMKTSKDVFDEQEEKTGRMSEELQTQFTDLRKNLTEAISTQSIAFKATDMENTSPSTGEVLVFPTVMFNSGNGYDSSNGIFTAPVDGLYLFTTQMCTNPGGKITASIMVEATEVGRSYTYDNNGVYSCNTGDAIIEVTAGQKVSVKTKLFKDSLYFDSHLLISFSGALMYKGN